MSLAQYRAFLDRKRLIIPEAGFDVSALNPRMFDFQEHVTRWAIRKGRSALFLECGLGKTLCQLTWADAVVQHTNKAVLIAAPLAVADQTVREGEEFGIEVHYVRNQKEAAGKKIVITNYEMLEHFDPAEFIGVVLDESSILKHFEGATKTKILSMFDRTPYKLECSATPAPNDPMEIGNHSEFLGIMTRTTMLARFFTHDGGDTSKWRLKYHAEDVFYRWLASWGMWVTKPSDIGFSDEKFQLPKLNIIEEMVESPSEPEEGALFARSVHSATNIHSELRKTAKVRAERVAEIAGRDRLSPLVVWCNTNYEADELTKVLPAAIEIRGTDSVDHKIEILRAFSLGQISQLITKGKITGMGLNWQHCHNSAHYLNHSYEQWYQAVRRFWRFGQQHEVNSYLIAADSEQALVKSLKRKARQHEGMQQSIAKITRELAVV